MITKLLASAVIVLGAAVGVAAPASADNPTPTPTPTRPLASTTRSVASTVLPARVRRACPHSSTRTS
jgi:hypothetical protein